MNIQSTSPHTRPSRGTATGRVWQLADEITQKQGYRAKRKQVIEAFAAEGGNANTASTQYHYWSQKYPETARSGSGHPTGSVQLRIEPNGRILVPAEYRDAMDLDKNGRVSARIVDGELRLISPKTALRKAQKIAKKFKKPGQSVVDEFLAGRKTMWGE